MPVSKHVPEILIIPGPPADPAALPGWLRDVLIPTLVRMFDSHKHTQPLSIRGENTVKPYLDASKPSASEAGEGAIILVTDAAAGQQFKGSVGGAYVNLG
jgi:hypothetical protein